MPDSTSIPDGYKRCKDCKRVLPLAEFWKVYQNQEKRHPRCIDCEYVKLGRPRPLLDVLPDGMKRCCDCKEIKPATNEYFHRNKHDKNNCSRRCKLCAYAASKQNYWSNAEAHKQYSRDWYRANPEKAHLAHREWEKRNPDKKHASSRKSYQKNKAQRLAWQKRYYAEFPEKRQAQYQKYLRSHPESREKANARRRAKPDARRIELIRRRARKYSLPDNFTTQDWQLALDHFNGCCAVCGRPPGLWHTLAMDHWIPLDSPDCPGTIPMNIVPLCHAKKDVPFGTPCCNNSKNNRDPIEWLNWKFGPRKAKRILARIEAYFTSRKDAP